ncbi:30S ribosomal protein S2 [Candidatus Micrarchaeota archaeon]|nr:MAG: 30S ribosomal protein S2 [Candidatus Micrarchaeota archaeon]
MVEKNEELLVPVEKYLETGAHIGSKYRSGDMKKFIYKCRNDGLCVLDITTLDRRIRIAANFISQYPPEKVLVVAGRTYAQKPAKKFSELVGTKCVVGRFVPGTLTNPNNENFIEPELVFVGDPPVDRQAIKEAVKARVPVISLCDTSNSLKNIDLVIPMNNKGKKALALVYWLLAREVLLKRGNIKSYKEFNYKIEDFMSGYEDRGEKKVRGRRK